MFQGRICFPRGTEVSLSKDHLRIGNQLGALEFDLDHTFGSSSEVPGSGGVVIYLSADRPRYETHRITVVATARTFAVGSKTSRSAKEGAWRLAAIDGLADWFKR
jgi:hypothetical protein